MKKTSLVLVFGSLLIAGLLVQASPNHPDSPAIGFEELDSGAVWHIWNENDDYYFNSSSGIQLTNHYDEYWSHNVFCGLVKLDEWQYKCTDSLPFSWSFETDNSSYVNINGFKIFNFTRGGNSYGIKIGVNYHLGSQDENLTVTPSIENVGTQAIPVDVGFAWKVKDIRISNTQENDYLDVDGSYYLLNQTLEMNFTNLQIPSFSIRDSVTNEYLQLSWEGDENYNLLVKSTQFQYNAPITLLIDFGPLAVNQTLTSAFKWIDRPPPCTWSCIMSAPASDPNITINETFTMTGMISASGLCPTMGSIYWQFSNGTWQYIPTSPQGLGQYIQSGTNPEDEAVVLCSTSRTIVGEKNATYTNRMLCYFNSEWGASDMQTVTVNPWGEVDCSNMVDLSSSLILSANNNSCFNFNSNNIILDCNGFQIQAPKLNEDYLFFSENTNNITIKNCILEGTINVWKGKNVTYLQFFNNTIRNGIKQSPNNAFFKMFNLQKSNYSFIHDNLIKDNYADNFGGETPISDYGIFYVNGSQFTYSYNNNFTNNSAKHSGALRMAPYRLLNNVSDLYTWSNFYAKSIYYYTILSEDSSQHGSNLAFNDSIVDAGAIRVDNTDNLQINNNVFNGDSQIRVGNDHSEIINNTLHGFCLFTTSENQIIRDFTCHGDGGVRAFWLSNPINITIENAYFHNYNYSTGNPYGIGYINHGAANNSWKNFTLEGIWANGLDMAALMLDRSGPQTTEKFTISGMNIRNVNASTSTRGHGIYSLSANNTEIINCNLSNIMGYDFVTYYTPSPAYLYDVTYNKSRYNAAYQGDPIHVFYTANIRVQDESNQSIENATVEIYDFEGNLKHSGVTDADGSISFAVEEFNQTDLDTYAEGCQGSGSNFHCFTPHTIYANGSNLSGFAIVNISEPMNITIILESPVTNETIARQAILEGINSAIPSSEKSEDQQVYIVYQNGEQELSSFDEAAVLGNQTWGFNYITGNETYVNMTGLLDVANIWEAASLFYSQIVSEVSAFIGGTRE
ncbi:MAG: carboxypeptidase-like regulatory domain-containing protein [Candidatus Micrarchaeota archaeon]